MGVNNLNQSRSSIGLFTLTLLTVSSVVALRNLPLMAMQGYSAIFFYTFAALLFFIPVCLACAELASGWSEEGGVYIWVKAAFGERAGALAIWFEWVESVVWLPTVLSFMAATAAYLINPELANNRFFLLAVMLSVLWSATLLNFFGVRNARWLSSLGILIGSLIPGVLIILLGWLWTQTGRPTEITFELNSIVPPFEFSTLVFFTGVLLSFAGMEVSSFHINDAKKPEKTYPKAIFIAAGLILSLYMLGSLAIAKVVPSASLSLTSGVMQAFHFFFNSLGVPWATPLLACFLLLGALALINAWIMGPTRGLYTSATKGNLPKITLKKNSYDCPFVILSMQCTSSTLLTLVFILMPNVNSSYWLLTVLSSQLVLMMYMLIFSAVIRLRYTRPNTPRSFKIPGGNWGVWLVAGIGGATCLFAFMLGLVPPKAFNFGSTLNYIGFVILGILTTSLPPFIWHGHHYLKNRSKFTN